MGAERIPGRGASRGQGIAWYLEGLKVIVAKAQTVGRPRPKGKLRQVGPPSQAWMKP